MQVPDTPVSGAVENTLPVSSPPSHPSGWSAVHRLGFRFVFCWIVLCVFPFPFNTFPGSLYQGTRYDELWLVPANWVGVHILHEPPTKASLSYFLGDTTAGYVELFFVTVIAALATIAWTLLDRKRAEYRRLHELPRIYVRYALAFTMLDYGFDKIFLLQFSTSLPGPEGSR